MIEHKECVKLQLEKSILIFHAQMKYIQTIITSINQKCEQVDEKLNEVVESCATDH